MKDNLFRSSQAQAYELLRTVEMTQIIRLYDCKNGKVQSVIISDSDLVKRKA